MSLAIEELSAKKKKKKKKKKEKKKKKKKKKKKRKRKEKKKKLKIVLIRSDWNEIYIFNSQEFSTYCLFVRRPKII